jgi:hypothetical protein
MKRVAKDEPWALVACRSCGNIRVTDGRVTSASVRLRLPKLRAHLRALLGDGNLSDHFSNTFVHCEGARLAMYRVGARTGRLTIHNVRSKAETEAARQHLAMILDQLGKKNSSKTGVNDALRD